jgi:putative SOS response-associated peptidase YedK
MCGRYNHSRASHVKKIGPFQVRIDWEPLFNVSPTTLMPVIVWEDAAPKVEKMQWGLIPFFSKEPKMEFNTINAKAETLNSKPMWKRLLKDKRCLIPADGFFEWEKAEDAKLPWRFVLKNREPFLFAGLWDKWSDANQEIHSFTIITTAANPLVSKIHNRMPVILHEADYETWLKEPKVDLLQPYPEAEMESYRVSTIVNSSRNKGAECIEPWK